MSEFVLALGGICALLAAYWLYQKFTSKADVIDPRMVVKESAAEDEKKGHPMTILYGSQSGTAETFAIELGKEAKKYHFNARVVDLEEYEHEDELAEEKFVVLLLATFGEGEPTDNAVNFYEWVMSDARMEDEDAKDVCYAVFALGNRQYEHFCNIGRNVAKTLKKLGGIEIIEHGEGDDDGSLEDDYAEWKAKFWQAARERFSSEEELQMDAVDTKFEASFEIAFVESEEKKEKEKGQFIVPDVHIDTHKYPGGGLATVLENRELRQSTHDQGSTKHIELDLSESKMTYNTADNLGILPRNDMKMVHKLAKRLNYDLDARFTLKPKEASARRLHYPSPCSVREALTWYCDITSTPKRGLLETLRGYCTDSEDVSTLKSYAGAKKDWYQKQNMKILEVLEAVPSCNPPLVELLEWIPSLAPRFYTISSSAVVNPKVVAATVALLRDPLPDSRLHVGVCSSYMCNWKTNKEKVACFIRRSSFLAPWANCKPGEESRPAVMVGPGTGVAPFRAFVQEASLLKKQGHKIGQLCLFFGCKKRDWDYIYQTELEEANRDGVLDKLVVAFSRETDKKVYVQHRMEEFKEYLWDLVHNKQGYFYVCGGTGMGRDARDALIKIAKDVGGMTEPAAKEYVRKMAEVDKRYIAELWS